MEEGAPVEMRILWRASGGFCALNGVKKWEDCRPNAVRFEAGVLGGEMFADWNDVNITLLFASEMANTIANGANTANGRMAFRR